MDGRSEFLMEAQLELEVLYPGVLTVDGTQMACARGGEEWELERERGGLDDDSEARVRVRVELLPERPAKNTVVDLDGRSFVVDEVARLSGDVVWNISLKRG